MEYQVFEEGDSNEVNVLLVAIKRDYITNFMKLVRRTGLRPVAISVSSLALYNFNELNNSSRDLTGQLAKEKAAKAKARLKEEAKNKKGKKKNEAVPGGEARPMPKRMCWRIWASKKFKAYVNLGASLMDLAIPKPGVARMIGFTRSVPLAGNEMDRAIRDKLALSDLAQALLHQGAPDRRLVHRIRGRGRSRVVQHGSQRGRHRCGRPAHFRASPLARLLHLPTRRRGRR